MTGTSIGLIFVFSLFFVCFTAGSTILNIFKIKKSQISSKVIIGFFALLSFITMISFVLNLFGAILTLQIYIYFLWGFILVFALVSIIFVKFWLKFFKINWNTLILLVVFISYVLFLYFKLDLDKTRMWGILVLGEIQMDFGLSGIEDFKNVFSQLMFAPLVVHFTSTGIFTESEMVGGFLFIFNVFIKAMMYTALTGIILEMGIGHTKVSRSIISIVITGSLFGYVALSTDLTKPLDASGVFIYLIQLISVMLAFYCVNQNRYKMYSYLLGIMTLAAVGMDQSKIIILLFFIYSILLILTYSFDNMLFKDHIKILFPVSLGALLYSLSTMNIVWIIITGGILALTILIVIWIFSSHVLIKRMEFTLSNRTSIFMIVVPTILIIFGILSFLAIPDWSGGAVEEKFGYLFKYKYLGLIVDPLVRLPILISITAFELIICFLWVSRRRKFKSKFSVILVDFTVIQYLMFYNPFARMFWLLVLENQTQIQYDIFETFYPYLIFAALIWVIQKVEKKFMEWLNIKLNREEQIKIVVYKNIFIRTKDRFNDWKNKTKDRRIKEPNKRMES